MSPRAAWRLETLGFTKVFEYAAGKSDWGAYGLPLEGKVTAVPHIAEIARTDVPRCRVGERVREAKERAKGWGTCFVVNEKGIVLGRLHGGELGGDPEALVEDVMRPGPSTFRPNVSVSEMLDYMNDNHLDTAPVTRSDGELIGLVLRADAERAVGEDRSR